ncbi:MAG: bifunctional tetrahydrofolate synthase/dihydrofolate synthase [Marinobacter sp.]|uniref:bifunctional tetrahydrofolate synthase/dihydrofolate synthase n=1 Tax=Marinobacter sp. TaxID=50741 RepID=UPI00299E93FA|nr:bifunctional tetrahydrofolate synthase/dihydrofolate synthase [Marinobacter sp.]MDX1633125.1 bifunctional tetrahydrofolate synthase/dihydrofolate synthase [Marinobacter sp.]
MSQPSKSRAAPARPGTAASLEQWLTYLEALHPSEIDLGLDRVLLVLRKLMPGRPRARIITVAGTNGKGSTVACLEALLMASGRRVGAYTSPHLSRYNERVRINGQEVSDQTLVEAFEHIEAARGNTSLTYFEFGTLAAFLVMAAKGLEDWVLEVGMGGRLDAVNTLDPDLAIITSVDIDHVAWLGGDRESIGFEKAGILRPSVAAIYADEDPPRSVLQQAQAQNVRLWRFGEDYQLQDQGRAVAIAELQRVVPLPTLPLPLTSVAAAVRGALWLEPALSDETIHRALERVRVPGRFERFGDAPAIYLDVGHNPHAARWLAGKLTSLKERRVHGVYGCLADKDASAVIHALTGVVDHWYLAGLAVPRGLTVTELDQRLAPVLQSCPPSCHSTVTEALEEALARAAEDDLVVVFGSFYTVAEAREYLLASDRS